MPHELSLLVRLQVQAGLDSARRYSPAWRSLEPTAGQTAEVLEASVQQVCPDAQLVEWASLPEVSLIVAEKLLWKVLRFSHFGPNLLVSIYL